MHAHPPTCLALHSFLSPCNLENYSRCPAHLHLRHQISLKTTSSPASFCQFPTGGTAGQNWQPTCEEVCGWSGSQHQGKLCWAPLKSPFSICLIAVEHIAPCPVPNSHLWLRLRILPIVPDCQTEPQQALVMAVCHLNPKHLWGLPTLPCLHPHQSVSLSQPSQYHS